MTERGSVESISERILGLLPQQKPFRFVDRIIEVDDDRIVGQYRFRQDESFYQGHFPDFPVTPGVILIEAMAQIGVVCHGLYLQLEASNAGSMRTFFTETEAEFFNPIYPDELITVKAEKIFWRRNKLKTKAELYRADGELAARATLAGIGKIL